MIPLSGWVLAAAALITAPALWSGLVEGSMPVDVALTRYLVVTAGCWVVFSVAAELIRSAPAASPVTSEEEPRPDPQESSDH